MKFSLLSFSTTTLRLQLFFSESVFVNHVFTAWKIVNFKLLAENITWVSNILNQRESGTEFPELYPLGAPGMANALDIAIVQTQTQKSPYLEIVGCPLGGKLFIHCIF